MKALKLGFLFGMVLLLFSCKSSYHNIDFISNYRFNNEILLDFENDSTHRKYQIAASEYAIKGDYKNALKYWDAGWNLKEQNYTSSQIDSLKKKYTKTNAVEYIVKESEKHEIIIMNEAHHNSNHRFFTKSLLSELYKKGYKNLGLEALFYQDNIDSLNLYRKYPIQKSGYYINDPQFGSLVREAIELGFYVFPYETQNEDSDGYQREIDQAKNIQAFLQNSPGKTIIHCGYDHAMEGKHSSWEKAMAGRLKEYTKKDPLTINQVVFSEKSDTKFNHPLLKTFEINEPTVLVDENQDSYQIKRNESYFDIAVLHKNTNYIHEKPDWLFTEGNKKVEVSIKNIPLKFPIMILAYPIKEDFKNAIPVDITEVKSKNDKCILALKKGEYKIVATNGKKSVFYIKEVK